MGIYKLNEVLQNNCNECFKTLPWFHFKGKKVAIDLDILIYKHFSICAEKVCESINPYLEKPDIKLINDNTISQICHHIQNTYIYHGVTPIIVYGGVAPPEKDICARMKRKAVKDNAEEVYKNEYNKYLPEAGKEKSLPAVVYNSLCKKLKATLRPTKDIENNIIERLSASGILVLKATTEAEELCAALCLEGLVHAVFSTDTDNIVRRCPILITKICTEETSPQIWELTAQVTVYSNNIPYSMGLQYHEFVDLCIMLGCDYNTTVPRWGIVKCLELIKTYKSIESIAENHPDKDLNVYNYVRCREIFNLNHNRSSKDCCANPDVIDFIV